MYRLRSAGNLWDIGREDYLDRGVSAPWSENVQESLEGAMIVSIEKLDENTRRITIDQG